MADVAAADLDRVAALAKIGRLLGPGAGHKRASAARIEAERKQAAVIGQSRGADDERESLESLLALLTGSGEEGSRADGQVGALGNAMRERLLVLEEEAVQRKRRLMKLRIAVADSDSDSDSSSGDDGDGEDALAARAKKAAAAMAAVAAAKEAPVDSAEARHKALKCALLAFVRSILGAALPDTAGEVPAALAPGGVLLDPAYWLGAPPRLSATSTTLSGSFPAI
eukprot:SAG11_NODE_6832_length_1238_cov_1.771730_1_plen_226_part_00